MKPTVNAPRTKMPARKGGSRPSDKTKRARAKKTKKPLAVAPAAPAASEQPNELPPSPGREASLDAMTDETPTTEAFQAQGEPQSPGRPAPTLSRQLKRQITRRLRPMTDKSRVLKFGIRGITTVRETLGLASGLGRWVAGEARRAIESRRGSKGRG